MDKKNKIMATILAICLGCVGFHHFYLGNYFRGFGYLLLFAIFPLLSFGFSIFDAIMLYRMDDDRFDNEYNLTIDKLNKILRKCWSRTTAYPGNKEDWSMENPALGQCAVTALIVNDYFGGKFAYNSKYHHIWNILDDGTHVDLTKEQFGDVGELTIDNYLTRDDILIGERAEAAKTKERYEILYDMVRIWM